MGEVKLFRAIFIFEDIWFNGTNVHVVRVQKILAWFQQDILQIRKLFGDKYIGHFRVIVQEYDVFYIPIHSSMHNR